MFDHDARFVTNETRDLEPHARDGPGGDRTGRDLEVGVGEDDLVRLGDANDLGVQGGGDQLDDRSPDSAVEPGASSSDAEASGLPKPIILNIVKGLFHVA